MTCAMAEQILEYGPQHRCLPVVLFPKNINAELYHIGLLSRVIAAEELQISLRINQKVKQINPV